MFGYKVIRQYEHGIVLRPKRGTVVTSVAVAHCFRAASAARHRR